MEKEIPWFLITMTIGYLILAWYIINLGFIATIILIIGGIYIASQIIEEILEQTGKIQRKTRMDVNQRLPSFLKWAEGPKKI